MQDIIFLSKNSLQSNFAYFDDSRGIE